MFFSVALAFALLWQTAVLVPDTTAKPQPQKPWVAPFTVMPQPPRLPKVDLNACPFEGCQFGKWTARKPVTVYSSWQPGRKPVATLQPGEEVTALTGVSLVLEPGKGMFDRDLPLYGAKKGDPVYMYKNCGEGRAADIWVRGRFIPCVELEFSSEDGFGCSKNCDGRWLRLGRNQWWAQIRLQDGKLGWVLVEDNFDGTDALA